MTESLKVKFGPLWIAAYVYSVLLALLGLGFLLGQVPPPPRIAGWLALPPLVATGLFWRRHRQVQALGERAVSTTGTVTETGRVTKADTGFSNPRVCYPEIAYEYDHDGESYRSETVFQNGAAVRMTPDDADTFLAEYTEGTETTVHVDPEDPTRSYLAPHPGWGGFRHVPAVYVLASVTGVLTVAAGVIYG
jgi:hypothetical protein